MPSARAFDQFCARIDLPLEPFQRRIVRAALDHRETLVLLPRGNGKTTLFAAFALWHLLTVRDANVILAASSVAQAGVAFDAAARFALHPELDGQVHVKTGYHELWVGDTKPPASKLKVISSDAPRAHGLQPSLVLIDELHAHRDGELYTALRTALGKRSDSRLVTITTAGHDSATVLGRLRHRGLNADHVTTKGSLTVGQDPQAEFCMLEWAVPAGRDPADPTVLKAANPASFVTKAFLAEQVSSPGIHPVDVARYHGNRWPDGGGDWLPVGAWQACAGDATIHPGEQVWVGVDIGGSRAASAVVIVTEDLRVHADVFHGDEAVLDVAERVRELADRYTVRECAFDPWRFRSEALRLEESRLMMVEFPQSTVRMVPATERLYAAIIERRLTHSNQPELNTHVAGAIAKQTPRGIRLDKGARGDQIDAAVALAMAVERAEQRTAPAEFLGWL